MEKTPSFLVEEVLPQITEVTRPMCESVSWRIEEDLGQSVESLCEGTLKVPIVRFDVGQLMCDILGFIIHYLQVTACHTLVGRDGIA